MTDNTFNYQKLNDELDKILQLLQSGDLDVEEALINYERGMEIVKQIESYLKQSENKVTKIKKKFDK